jgi:hypothetical protein
MDALDLYSWQFANSYHPPATIHSPYSLAVLYSSSYSFTSIDSFASTLDIEDNTMTESETTSIIFTQGIWDDISSKFIYLQTLINDLQHDKE